MKLLLMLALLCIPAAAKLRIYAFMGWKCSGREPYSIALKVSDGVDPLKLTTSEGAKCHINNDDGTL